jgi:NDP-sugar pyrophosphorylase family protein
MAQGKSSSGVIAVIPAAGYARRLQPIGASKEMLPVAGRPIIAHLVDRLRMADPEAIHLVTRPAKIDLVAWATAEGLEVILSEPPFVTSSLLDGLRDVADDAIVITGFPDTIWEPLDAFVQLVRGVRNGSAIELGLFETNEPHRCDIVEIATDGTIARVAVKPAHPRGSTTWGCFAARAGALRPMDAWEEPGQYFDAACRSMVIRGTHFPGCYEDIGTRASLSRITGANT